MGSFDIVDQVVEQAEGVLHALLLSGFGVVSQSSMKELRQMVEELEEIGFSFGAQGFGDLAAKLEDNRHQMQPNRQIPAEVYCKMSAFIDVVKQKRQLEKMKEKMSVQGEE
jgi:hypothetical protein